MNVNASDTMGSTPLDTTSSLQEDGRIFIPFDVTFSIVFVSIGMSCFVWQTIESGWIFHKSHKPLHGIVFAQAFLGVVVTFVTLLTSFVEISCTFRLLFSVVGVNLGDFCLQYVLLCKAYIGNQRSKIVLFFGALPLLGILIVIILNFTLSRSESYYDNGVCITNYPLYGVIIKTAVDSISNTMLSYWFILVIYRQYKLFGTSVQKTLIAEAGYLSSYLIIKQLKYVKESPDADNRASDEENQSIRSRLRHDFMEPERDTLSLHLPFDSTVNYSFTSRPSYVIQKHSGFTEKSVINTTTNTNTNTTTIGHDICPPSPFSVQSPLGDTISEMLFCSPRTSSRRPLGSEGTFGWSQTTLPDEENKDSPTSSPKNQHRFA
ncbi:hypothetical protein PHYBLDRAFT_139323 [Phycomyces blakesleeanus NRRL 1555(-)]|uniref:Transmembrane protein n=1 Tax=Phycomyces blakesleeanus (strain ATCC 8743b / DSM 1359 / FGSC 10004 / NBRC 33097 / NRRL 1555) TaxID=763407 RepID=A0A167Q900_PHYB8|nr:hypothetical protein PHYBLDRAFT_139323 [Phycomyces blakesleeanus NRRL 1555(-)]OAD79289.1 hypothetical protein PHYBLDRAFT_139323 [Phycomyces blakesleeanus NRRL 1555(-)]|eukprot:XP_018297329.1 hypothetical protein PHYBLDRAFT_139323 [Phycomyces blakesleeanus NRRL 1555(-)]